MPLAATSGAIGAVSQLLRDHLTTQLPGVGDVLVGRPHLAAGGSALRLNLFLYEVQFDPHLKNISLEEDGPPPLWLSLKYLLTAFDATGDSDSIDAHELLGAGIRALQAVNFAPPPGTNVPELDDSPDMLKVTFDDATPELVSRITQGSDERFRCSVGFQIRPLMIAPPEPATTGLLVGVDYTAGSSTILPEAAVQVAVVPTLGPQLTSVLPLTFEAGAALSIRGTGLTPPEVSLEFDGAPLTIVERRPDGVEATVPLAFNAGVLVSAGTWPLIAVRLLAGGRRRSSNPLVAGLRPLLNTAVVGANVIDPTTNITYRTVNLTGRLLGTDDDDVIAAVRRNGVTYGPFDRFVPPAVPPVIAQSERQLQIPATEPLPAGSYRLILRVNGQQARHSPEIIL